MNSESLELGGELTKFSRELAMSSRDIAERTGKQHRNVTRDIEKMFLELEIDVLKFGRIYQDSRNREQKEYLLTKELTLTLVSGYNLKLRSAIIQRWQDLEKEEAMKGFNLPSSFSEALRMLADSTDENQKLLGQVEDMTPKAVFHDRVTASDSVCQMAVACQVAKLPHGRNTLYRKLRADGVLISTPSRYNLPKQSYIDSNLFTVEESSYEHPKTKQTIVSYTTHVTQKGIDWLIKNYSVSQEDAA